MTAPATAKRYDRRYFDRWYRGRGINPAAAVARKVALAVACAEFHLGRPIHTVLDVGCGEGAWRAPLRRLRPDVAYLGLDPSAYAIARYGRHRNLVQARFADLPRLRLAGQVDLLVCADVLHYLDDAELRAGLAALPDLCQGVAWLETYCTEDAIEGDLVGFHARPARAYRQRLARLGLRFAGSHCWLMPELAVAATALETSSR